MARQRRLDATVAEYRRLVALEEEETQSTGTTTTSTGTAVSSSMHPRAASQRSAPAVRSRATKANRHRRAAKTAAAPHRSCKARQRRLSLSVSYLEQEVHTYKNLVEGLRFDHATLRKEYDALAAKVNSTLP
ncbi:uncharacterized protein LOC144782140 [Lissotriton helveticus]